MFSRILITAIVATGGSIAGAQVIQGTLSNFDVWNNTGMLADDFEVELGGISTTAINSLYTGDYPNVGLTGGGGGTTIRWTGNATAPGGMSHFGLGITGDLNPTSVRFSWTQGGNVIGNIPDAWQKWNTLTNGAPQDVVANGSDVNLWVQRSWGFVDTFVILDDLVAGSSITSGLSLIDTDPVMLMSGGELTFDFDPGLTGSALISYTVWSDDNGQIGDPLMTFYNAALVPAPAPLALLAASGLLASRRRR